MGFTCGESSPMSTQRSSMVRAHIWHLHPRPVYTSASSPLCDPSTALPPVYCSGASRFPVKLCSSKYSSPISENPICMAALALPWPVYCMTQLDHSTQTGCTCTSKANGKLAGKPGRQRGNCGEGSRKSSGLKAQYYISAAFLFFYTEFFYIPAGEQAWVDVSSPTLVSRVGLK